MDVKGKAAIVTGGGTGIGRATALALADLGCSVLVNYSKSRQEAEVTAADVAARGVKSAAIQADVADDDACRRMVDKALKDFGRLDILVNNAATTSFIPHQNLEQVKVDDWNRILGVNVIGAFQCSRAAKEALVASGSGEIVNISSVAGVAGIGSSIPYCASKAALNNMTVTLARVLAPSVRVNAIAPGFVATRWLQKGLGDSYEAGKKAAEQRTLLHKVCEPEDVASAVLGIITGSDLLTGQIIPLEGGMLHANFSLRLAPE